MTMWGSNQSAGECIKCGKPVIGGKDGCPQIRDDSANSQIMAVFGGQYDGMIHYKCTDK